MAGGWRWPQRPFQVLCFQVLCLLVAVLLTALLCLQFTPAERAGAHPIPDKPNLGRLGERLNANTIAIVSGNPNATYLTIAYDLSDVLDDGDNFRILPVIGKGMVEADHDVNTIAVGAVLIAYNRPHESDRYLQRYGCILGTP